MGRANLLSATGGGHLDVPQWPRQYMPFKQRRVSSGSAGADGHLKHHPVKRHNDESWDYRRSLRLPAEMYLPSRSMRAKRVFLRQQCRVYGVTELGRLYNSGSERMASLGAIVG